MISVSQKIKVAVSHLLRTQMELDIEDYGLKGFGDLCNRILAHYADFPEPNATVNEDILYKTVAPLQFSLNRSGESFANFANSQNIATAALCRHYFECYANMPRGKRECFLFQESTGLLNKAIKERKNVYLTYREEHKNVAPCFLAFSPSQVRVYLVGRMRQRRIERCSGKVPFTKALPYQGCRAGFTIASFPLPKF
jgi:hypothetical protein